MEPADMTIEQFQDLTPVTGPRGILFCYEVHRQDSVFPKKGMKKLDSDRWRRAKRIYIVLMDEFQLGLAERLDCVPHYQVSLVELQAFLSTLLSSCPSLDRNKIKIVGTETTFEDEHFCIINSRDPILSLDWQSGVQLLLSASTPTGNQPDRRQRQYADVGFASGVSTSKTNGCRWGVARPNLKPLTLTCHGQNVMNNTNRIYAAVCSAFPGRVRSLDKRVADDFLSQHGGATASSRFAKTDEQMLCGAHCDNENGATQVQWAAALSGGERLVQVCYDRKSITDYYRRRDDVVPLLEVCKEWMEKIPHCRRMLLPGVWQKGGPDGSTLPRNNHGLPVTQISCNMEVAGFYQPFISVLYHLHRKFDLDLPNALSVVCAMATYSYCALYALVAAEIVIHKVRKQQGRQDIGYLLLTVMDLLEESEVLDSSARYRFNRYKPARTERNQAEWSRRVTVFTSLVKATWDKAPDSLAQADYDILWKYVSEKEFPQVGSLKANHALGMAALSGLVPLPLFGMVRGGSRSFDKALRACCSKPLPELSTILSNLRSMLKAVPISLQEPTFVSSRCHVSERYVENLACKMGRIVKNTDGRFADIIDNQFPLFAVRQLSPRKVALVFFTMGDPVEHVTEPLFKIEGNSFLPVNFAIEKACRDLRPAGIFFRLDRASWRKIKNFYNS
jgi:hypothetical protein